MNCSSVRERLSAHLDADLPEEEAAALRDHLARCADCANEAKGLGTVVRAVAALERELDPGDLWPGIAARLGTEAAIERPAAPWAARVLHAVGRGLGVGQGIPALAWRLGAAAALLLGLWGWQARRGAPASAWEIAPLAGAPVLDDRGLSGARALHPGDAPSFTGKGELRAGRGDGRPVWNGLPCALPSRGRQTGRDRSGSRSDWGRGNRRRADRSRVSS